MFGSDFIFFNMQVVHARIYKMDTLLPALHIEATPDIVDYITTVIVDLFGLVIAMDTVSPMVHGHQVLQRV